MFRALGKDHGGGLAASYPQYPRGVSHDDRTCLTNDCRPGCLGFRRALAASQPLLAPSDCVCRFESPPIGIHQLVSHGMGAPPGRTSAVRSAPPRTAFATHGLFVTGTGKHGQTRRLAASAWELAGVVNASSATHSTEGWVVKLGCMEQTP